MGNLIEHQDYLVQPDGFNIPYDAERIHGISTELAQQQGVPLQEVLEKFNTALSKTKFIVGQNVGFDVNIMGCEFYRLGIQSPMTSNARVRYLYRSYSGAIKTYLEDVAENSNYPH